MKDYSVLAGSLGTPRPKAACEPIPRADRDAPWTTEAHYRTAREIVRDRSAGVCEFDGCTAPASNVHHRAGRGFPGCHHPDLLLNLCGNGNIDGCHGLAHAGRKHAEALGLLLPHGTTADQLDKNGCLP